MVKKRSSFCNVSKFCKEDQNYKNIVKYYCSMFKWRNLIVWFIGMLNR